MLSSSSLSVEPVISVLSGTGILLLKALLSTSSVQNMEKASVPFL